jgi:hypothetical protein
VPVNYATFRLIGRLEWAWVAAPIISVAGAVAITRLAQLDIGFSRSRHTISLLEMHAGHPVAHVSEFTALYSSLSTRYRFEFEQSNAQLLPMVLLDNVDRDSFSLANEPLRTIEYQRGLTTVVDGFPVQSNSTGLLHSERMVDLGGSISATLADDWSEVRVDNRSSLELDDCVLLARRQDQWLLGYAQQLEEGPATIRLEPRSLDDCLNELVAREAARAGEGPDRSAGRTNLAMIRAELFNMELQPGDARLIGTLPQPVSPMKCTPRETQSSGVSVLVLHVAHGNSTRAAPPQ